MITRRRLALALAALGLVASAAPALPAATVSLSEPHAVLAGYAEPATGALFTFASTLEGKPIRWNPCEPIHWQFRPNGAPTGGFTVVKQSVAAIAAATGTTWVYDGYVSTAPSTAWLPKSTSTIKPLLIGWTDGGTSDLLRGQPRGVLGVTRTAWFGRTVDGHSVAAIKAAVVALDRTDTLPLTGGVSWRTVLLHELGHAMGLDHAGSTAELMYPVLQRNLTGLQAGDKAGLARLGRAAGCVNA